MILAAIRIRIRKLKKYLLSYTHKFLWFSLYIHLKVKTEFDPLKPIIQINLSHNANRYLYAFIEALICNNYRVVLYAKWDTLLDIKTKEYSRKLIEKAMVSLTFRKSPLDTSRIVFSDFKMKNTKHIKISYDYFLLNSSAKIWRLPIGYHPENIEGNFLVKSGINPQNSQRSGRILFIGNLTREAYGRKELSNLFNCLSRNELMDTIRSNFNSKLIEPASIEQINDKVKSGFEILICDGKKYPVWHSDYFRILVSSDFFICASGFIMPFSHNAMEAMAAGCIPLIEYGEWFTPPLEHRRNAIIFKGRADLIDKISIIFEMRPTDIAQMRKELLIYVDKYHSKKSMIENVLKRKEFLLNSEGHSVSLLSKRLTGSSNASDV